MLFLIIAPLFYVLLIFICGTYVPPNFFPNLKYRLGAYGHTFSRLNEAKYVKDIDILFLGSSHAYRGFDTRMYSKNGYKTFNLGSSAQTPIQTKALIDRYLTHINPKIVVFEVYSPTLFNNDGVESAVDIISNDINDLFSLKMALQLNHIIVYNTFIYATVRDILNLNKTFEEPIKKGKDNYIPGGYVERKISHYKPTSRRKRIHNINEEKLFYLTEIVSTIKKRNIEVFLVNAPISKSLYSSYQNNYAFDEIMRKHSTYYNFNELLTLDDSLHFYDNNHLNQFGVEIFNKKLIELLKSSDQ